MIRFVQACDRNYEAQGLALYRSLEQHMTGEWAMDWYALSPQSHSQLHSDIGDFGQLELHFANEYSQDSWHGGSAEFEAAERTPEWYWKWAAIVTAHAARWHPDDVIVYVDSDCWFMDDPSYAIGESALAFADVASLTHRFPAHRADASGRGGWWVGFNIFRPTMLARGCAAWWAAMVRAHCVLHHEGDALLGIPAGLVGDQPYLHAFERMAVHHEIATPGFMSSWNADDPRWLVPDDPSKPPALAWESAIPNPVWLWHGHEYRFDQDGTCIKRTGYPIPPHVQRTVVDPWCAAVQSAAMELAL